jgi:DNA-binding transcriptional LysR family regulator
MDIYQLKTFVVVAREGSIARAVEQLHLSQPAVSAHIKAIEDEPGLVLFERTPRGMSLSGDGERLLGKAKQTLAAHQELLEEASRVKGHLTGTLRLGAGSNSNHEAIGRLLTMFSERCPEVNVALRHGTSQEILTGIRNGSLDAGFYNEAGTPDSDLSTLPVSEFKIYVVASPGLVVVTDPIDWKMLESLPWIYPPTSACCGRTAEDLFHRYQIRPKRILNVDREDVTRSLIAGGMGVGLLHADTAKKAQARGEVELIFESHVLVRVLFAYLATREHDPLLMAAAAILRTGPNTSAQVIRG